MWDFYLGETVICILNIILLVLLSVRLQLHKVGIFSVGFITLYTAVAPHYVFTPLYILATGDPRLTNPSFANALVLVSLQLAGLLAGALVTTRRRVPVLWRVPEVKIPIGFLVFIFASVVVAFLAMRGFLLGTLNPLAMLDVARTPEFRTYYVELELGYPSLILEGALYFTLALLVIRIYRASPTVAGLGMAVGFTVLTAFVLLATGSRSAFFTPMLIFLVLTNHFYRRIPIWLILVLIVVAIPVFVIVRIASGGATLEMTLSSQMIRDPQFILQEFLDRFRNLDAIVDFLTWFRGQDFALGRTILEFPLRPIPRSILANKPSSLDVFLSYAIYGRPEYGGGVSIFGGVVEMYYNYWVPGVLIWFFMIGSLLYRVHFGFFEFKNAGKLVALAMVVGNPIILRGLATMGVSTSATQQLLMFAAAQGMVLLALAALSRIYEKTRSAPSRRRPYNWRTKPLPTERTSLAPEVAAHPRIEDGTQ